MATYSQFSTITAVAQSTSLTDNGSSTVNFVVPSNSKATIRVSVVASMPSGPVTSVSASFSASGFGVIAAALVTTNATDSSIVEQVVLGAGTHSLSVAMSGANPGNGNATAKIVGVLETFS